MTPACPVVYHLALADGWAAAQRAGRYDGTPDDRRDGFVHCSTAAQLGPSAAKHRAGRDDVVLLWLDAAALGAALRWEPSRGGALFPHVYGGVPLAAVRRAEPLRPGADGRQRFPPLGEPVVLTVPGWAGSGPAHWQTCWEAEHGYGRVQQADWESPRRSDWLGALDAAVRDAAAPPVLVAHSLGCIVVAHWATGCAGRAAGALLVAPADVDMLADLIDGVQELAPVPTARLPFPATVVASRDDVYADFARAEGFARAWGATLVDAGHGGHLNAESGLGTWEIGHRALGALFRRIACG